MCVESCPDDTKSFWLAAEVIEAGGGSDLLEKQLNEEMKPYCDPELFSKDKKPKTLMKEQICPYWILPSNPFVGRW